LRLAPPDNVMISLEIQLFSSGDAVLGRCIDKYLVRL
jgi:hypothetical protein